MSPAVARHRTALTRNSLSRPLTQALADRLLDPARSLFDYGCGRGDDLRHLAAVGIAASGWDPTHRPHASRQPADVVNLGYVINVIEDPAERGDTLRRAWTLAQRLLVVAGRLTWDARDLAGQPLGDGILTRTGTFQKFYEHTELASWIEQTLGELPLAAAPGIFYVFRDPADAQQFLANRVSAYRPRIRIDPHAVYDAHRDLLTPLADFLTDHARPPRDDELPAATSARLREVFGSLGRACQIIRQVTDDAHWEQVTAARRADLLVYIGLSRFGPRARVSQLPPSLARDIKAQFGGYQAACAKADRLLFAAGKTDLIDLAACSSPVGKLTPSALYVHRSALARLPPLLRLYEGCAQALAGTVERANIIKLSVAGPQVSYLAYPSFDRDAHPTLSAAVTVSLSKLTVSLRDYAGSDNPPLIHRKEEFVAADHPRRELWERLTRAEIRAGLYEHPEKIGTLRGWQETLAAAGVDLRGHRLTRTRSGITAPQSEPGQ
jgi:DNA phosphorothioation-associated putative methyltransferase